MRKIGLTGSREGGGNITTRRGKKGSRGDRAIERPFPLDCRYVCRANQGDFVRVRARKSKLEN